MDEGGVHRLATGGAAQPLQEMIGRIVDPLTDDRTGAPDTATGR
jgi:hypothetical protein